MLYQTMWWKLENPFLTPYLPTTPQSVGKPHIWGNVHALLRVTFFTLLAPHWNLECYWKNNLICFETSQIIKLFQISLFVKFYISRPFNSCKHVLRLSSHVFVVSILHDFTSIRLFLLFVCLEDLNVSSSNKFHYHYIRNLEVDACPSKENYLDSPRY